MSKRSCGDCTKCCEGWLTGQALGHQFYRGKPCHFISIGKGCSVYAKRPQEPCVSFKCEWLSSEDIPEWMKPSEIDTILVRKTENEIEYLSAVEAGSIISSRVLTWLIEYALSKNLNFIWSVENGLHWIGSPAFNQLMMKKRDPSNK